MPMTIPSMTETLGAPPAGAAPAVDVVADLAHKRGYTFNSWYVVGHLTSDERRFDCLVHLIAVCVGGITVGVDSAASITEGATGWYGVQHGFHPVLRARACTDRLLVTTPYSRISGTLEAMAVHAGIRGGSIDLRLRAIGHPLYNKGTGRFDMLGMEIFQYSIPRLETTGRLTIGERHYPVSGICWFDRQWQKQKLGPPQGRWTWMDLNLSNGWQISLWDAVGRDGRSDAWVTVIDREGLHRVADLVSLAEHACDYWISPQSGARFPTCWRVLVPSLDLDLTVTARPRAQEVLALQARYEGASDVSGTVGGVPVSGYSYVEMVGDWQS